MKWTTRLPDFASWRWWLPAASPMVVLCHKSGVMRVFGDSREGVPLAGVQGLWSDEPIEPDMDCSFEQPSRTGYYWYEIEVGVPPIVVSVYQLKDAEPYVCIIGMPQGLPLSQCLGRWSKEPLAPPTEVELTSENKTLQQRTPEP